MKASVLALAILFASPVLAEERGPEAPPATEETVAPEIAAERAGRLIQGGTGARCFDGDTFKLTDRRVLRLAGIDAPETPRGSTRAQYYARSSRKILEDLVRGRKLDLSIPGLKPKDQYGRILVEARTDDDEQSVNERMVSLGAAFFYPHQDLGPAFQESLARLQADAIRDRRGMWAYVLSQPIAEKPYVGNRETLRFFPADCDAAAQIKPRNRVNFGNLMDAFLAGYAPSRACVFWPVATD